MSSEFVSRRSFGDVEAASIHTALIADPSDFGKWTLPAGWAAENADRDADGRAVMGVNCLYVRTPDASVLVDPSDWTEEDDVAPYAEIVRGPRLEQALAILEVDPAAITHVLITHGHPDHYNGVLAEPRADGRLRFPNATHYFPAADWPRFVTDPPELPAGHSHRVAPSLLLPVERAGRLRLVEGDLEVAAGVKLLHTGGETEGHQIVRVDTPAGALFYLGDLFHLPPEFEQLESGPAGRDYAELGRIRARLLAEGGLADERAVALSTHGRFPAWGTVETTAAGGFRWRYG